MPFLFFGFLPSSQVITRTMEVGVLGLPCWIGKTRKSIGNLLLLTWMVSNTKVEPAQKLMPTSPRS